MWWWLLPFTVYRLHPDTTNSSERNYSNFVFTFPTVHSPHNNVHLKKLSVTSTHSFKQNMEDKSHSEPNISFIVTGFGPFRGMDENPTTNIIRHLQSEKEKGNLEQHIEFTKVITTSASSAKNEVNEIMQYIIRSTKEIYEQKDTPRKHWVIVHLGVNHMKGRKPSFQLEQNAYNEANFRIADEDGFQPKNERIILDGTLKLATDINVRRVMANLNDFDVVLSGDAGRFVCNYIYYTSLNAIQETFGGDDTSSDIHVHSLFVHVPKFDAFAEDVQFDFSKRLLNAISEAILAKNKKKNI